MPASRTACATDCAERRTSSGGKLAAEMLGMRQRSTSVCFQWSSRASRSPSASRTIPFAAMLTLPSWRGASRLVSLEPVEEDAHEPDQARGWRSSFDLLDVAQFTVDEIK